MSTAQILSMAIGTLIPLANGLLTRYDNKAGRVYLGLVLSGANGLLVEWLTALNDNSKDFNLTAAALGALLSLVTALSVEAKVWAPLGVSEAVKSAGVGSEKGQHRDGGWGGGPTPAGDPKIA